MKRVTISRATLARLREYSFDYHRRFVTEGGATRIDRNNVYIEVDDEVYRELMKLTDDPEDAILLLLGKAQRGGLS